MIHLSLQLVNLSQRRKTITYHNLFLKEKDKLEKLIEKTKMKLSKMPDGKFIFIRNGKYSKWYKSVNGKHHYIPKENQDIAEKLAYKQYLTTLLESYQYELNSIKYYLKHHLNPKHKLPFDHPDYRKLLAPYFKPMSDELADWANSDYDTNTKYLENTSYRTSSGHSVRSKSEMLIDMALYTNKIPFRYECALPIANHVYYPDFTIRHPRTGKTYYWEHFGLMDDSGYRANAFSKLSTYSSIGIIPGINLITTYENQDNPINSDMINRIIEYYFL